MLSNCTFFSRFLLCGLAVAGVFSTCGAHAQTADSCPVIARLTQVSISTVDGATSSIFGTTSTGQKYEYTFRSNLKLAPECVAMAQTKLLLQDLSSSTQPFTFCARYKIPNAGLPGSVVVVPITSFKSCKLS